MPNPPQATASPNPHAANTRCPQFYRIGTNSWQLSKLIYGRILTITNYIAIHKYTFVHDGQTRMMLSSMWWWTGSRRHLLKAVMQHVFKRQCVFGCPGILLRLSLGSYAWSCISSPTVGDHEQGSGHGTSIRPHAQFEHVDLVLCRHKIRRGQMGPWCGSWYQFDARLE